MRSATLSWDRKWPLLRSMCLIILVLGCSGFDENSPPALYPVTGTVTIDGKPAEHVSVKLLKADNPELPPAVTGSTDTNGEFSLSSIVDLSKDGLVPKLKKIDGVEPGEYFIAFSWQKPIRSIASEQEYGPELLPEKYQTPHKSDLPELKVTINAGENQLPKFELSSK